MTQSTADLSRLSRPADTDESRGACGGAGGAPGPLRPAVPMPRHRWRTRVLLPGAIVLGAGGMLAYSAWDSLAPSIAVHVVPVIVRADLPGGAGAAAVQAPGWVEPDPYPLAASALADGVLKEVLVLEGESVKAGQVIARLVDDDARLALRRAEADVAERQAALSAAQAELESAQKTWDEPYEPKRRLALAEAALAEREAEVIRQPADVAAAAARATELQADFDRIKKLHEGGQSSDIEFIRVRQQFLQQQAVVDSTAARQGVLEALRDAARAEVTAAAENLRLRIAERRALDGAKAQLQRAAAALDLARAARDEAALRLERMNIVAPQDGVVLRREASPGSKLVLATDEAHSTHVAHLYDPRRLQVRVDVPLSDAAAVGVGQEAEVVVSVRPDRTFRGRVTRVTHEADIQKNTLQVKVAIDEPSADIKPEMLARVRFLAPAAVAGGGEASSRVFAPARLVRGDGRGGGAVWVLDQARSVASRRNVTVGTARAGEWIEVTDGLNPGDRLIADGLERLSDGTRVRVIGELPSDEAGTPPPGGG